MKQILIAMVCLFMGAGAASAQTGDTRVCDILAHPKDFDGKMVRVTGTVVAGFDEFMFRNRELEIGSAAIVAEPLGYRRYDWEGRKTANGSCTSLV